MSIEIWKDIKGYEGLYQVSNFGNVRRYKTGKQKMVYKQHGYYNITLFKNGEDKHFRVSRLVAIAFLHNPDNLPEVNHKDENKLNNNVENLEFCTRKYNVNYGTGVQRRAKARSIPVVQKTKEKNIIKKYHSLVQASKETGICHSCIWKCVNGKRKSAGGYLWESVEKE